MAAATYTTDLTTLHILDSDISPAAVAEPTGSTAGTTIAIETDHYVVGTACISKIFNATGVGGLGFQNGTTVTIPTDGAVYMWTNFLAANSISSKATGGMQILVGNTLANYKRFYIYGDDSIAYGGWQVNAVNPGSTASANQGTPSGVWQYFGMAANVDSAVARGYPLCWDAVRYGRGSIIITNGDLANGYATFDAAAIVNDTNTTTGPVYNRWGIFGYANGTYTLQGRLALGSSGTTIDFRDSNRAIFIKSTDFVTSNFNTIEIINAASRVDWTGISISSLSTVSKGRVLVTDNADVNIDSCTFTDMNTFTFQSNSTILNSVFRRDGLVTQGSAVFNGCTFDKPSGTIGITGASTTISSVSNSSFISGGTGHAIEITGSAANVTLTNVNFSGYAASSGSTGNEAVFVNIATGSMNLTITGGTTPSVRTAGALVTVISGAVSVDLTATNISGTPIQDAQVLVEAAGAPLPTLASVTIVNSGTTSTVTHTGHGLSTNDKVKIKGASHYQNNGVFSITKINNDSYSYTMPSAPGSNPTGTITCTFVFLSGVTGVDGTISMSRVISSNQLVTGWVRKSSGSPYYKTAPVSGTVSSTSGASFTALLISDE